MLLLQWFARNVLTVSLPEDRGRPNSENLSASDDGSVRGQSDRDRQQALEPYESDAAITGAPNLALLAQCVP